jgi:AraC-like DNA-binding protein
LLRAIRDYVLSSTNGDHGLPAILRDPSIGRALGALHQRPENAWTVASLADEANLSRSGFAARFRVRVGTTPQRYLQRYRFSKALQLLQKHGRQDLRHRSPRGVRLRVFFQQGVQTAHGQGAGSLPLAVSPPK